MRNSIMAFIQKIRRLFQSTGTQTIISATSSKAEEARKTVKSTSKHTDKNETKDKLSNYLTQHYAFRYNILTEQNEFRNIHTNEAKFASLSLREMNTLCIELRNAGINCWDRDLARYVNSSLIRPYHPFQHYLNHLPAWDGTDRLQGLAQRVSSHPYWIRHFHRWMLALTAQWMGVNQIHANSVAPLLISEEQGWQKSTFCQSLMPQPLKAYYTDQLNLSSNGQEKKLALMGLINLDEFDRLTPKRMAQLKNLMQLPVINIRKAYQQHYQQLPRIASFIGTSNRKDLLTDPTGSRRFLCIEVEQAIDCTGLDLDQIYAQLKAEIESGERYWFTHEEEAEIQEHNKAFYQATPEEELFQVHFRAASADEPGELLSLAEIIEVIRQFHRGLIHNLNLAKFSSALVASGVERIHTRVGNRYRVVRLCEGGEG